jgi:DNA-binding CsgD family transcriptional regulator
MYQHQTLTGVIAAVLADVLDGLQVGLFLIDCGGGIIHRNTAADEILHAGDPLRSLCGRLMANDTRADRTLREAIAAVGHGDATIGGRATALPLTAQNGDRYIAHLLPLTACERHLAGTTLAAVAALVVRKATMGAWPAEIVGESYNLTPAELRVLSGIVEIGGVPEVAAALGVADTTIKTHLGRLFEKTGTSRQADLVKLVAGFTMPSVR